MASMTRCSTRRISTQMPKALRARRSHGLKTGSWRRFPEQRRSDMAEGGSTPTGGLGDLFSRLQEARADLEAQEEAIEATIVEGHAAGGAVVIRLTGSLGAEFVHIDPSTVAPAHAALHDALGRIIELRSSVQAPVDPAFAGGVDLGGFVGNLDLGGLLAGVDLEGLMGNLGMGMDLSALAGLGELGAGEGEGARNRKPRGRGGPGRAAGLTGQCSPGRFRSWSTSSGAFQVWGRARLSASPSTCSRRTGRAPSAWHRPSWR